MRTRQGQSQDTLSDRRGEEVPVPHKQPWQVGGEQEKWVDFGQNVHTSRLTSFGNHKYSMIIANDTLLYA